MDQDALKDAGDRGARGGEPRVPGYRIDGVLGRGATGTVYRARQLSVDREVALKVLHPELVGARRAELRLQREARTTARLAHPNIISAFDMGEVDGMWWYAMELVDGVSLAEKIRERPLSEREALRIFIPLVEALQHAFERGVVHRDIKPANILVERGGRALLVDLGLAYAEDDPELTKSGGTLGTPHYMSPEQARDPSGADAQSDLWSLGATMYHAVTGRTPFRGDSVAEILSSVLYDAVPDPRERAASLSSGFALVLRKCLTRDRAQRYATPAELLADLERIRERRAPSVRGRGLEPWARGRPRGRWLAAGVLAALVSAGGVAWLVHAWRGEALDARTDPAADARRAEDPLGAFAAAVSGPASGLVPALERAEFLLRTRALPSEDLTRLDVLRADLDRRVRREAAVYREEVDRTVRALIAERRFREADAEIAAATSPGLRQRLGSGTLPTEITNAFANWRTEEAQRVAEARATAVAVLDQALEQDFDRRLAPEVDRRIQNGDWRGARALLTVEARAWIESADVPRAGLEPAEIEAATTRLLAGRVAARRDEFDARWSQLDGEIVAAVRERLAALRADVQARAIVDAGARLRRTYLDELTARGLDADDLPAGLLHLAHEAATRGEAELVELERRLATEDARRGLAELDAELLDAWRSRRYADVARAYALAAEDAWRAPVRADVELRAREARLLQDMLARAALELGRRDGQRVELRVGTIPLEGTLASSGDPLRSGFRLVLAGGREHVLALRAAEPVDSSTTSTSTSAPKLLGADEVLRWAGVPLEGAAAITPADRLLRALFLLREGDVGGARAALNAGPLPRDEALVGDLEERLRAELASQEAAAGERRTAMLERLFLVRREYGAGVATESLRRRIERLLSEEAGSLRDDEVRELRRMRDERFASTAAEELTVADVFGPTSLEELPGARVRLRYDFDRATAGAFAPGTWIPEGSGWSGLRYVRSDEELLARASPTLVLREPLRVQNEPVDVRVRFDALPDSRAEFLFLTCAGFHVALDFQSDGARGRCFVDSGDPAAVLARSRAGEGKECAGWRGGTPLDVRLVVQRARGIVTVELDGKRVGEFQKPVPRGDPASSTLQIRSWEPVRLRSVVLEAARRP